MNDILNDLTNLCVLVNQFNSDYHIFRSRDRKLYENPKLLIKLSEDHSISVY